MKKTPISEEDSSGLYELSGLKKIFEEVEKEKNNFWDDIETDYWEEEKKKKFDETTKQISSTDQNLVLNRTEYYDKIEEITKGLNNEMSKNIFEDDFKESESKEDEIDPFWLN